MKSLSVAEKITFQQAKEKIAAGNQDKLTDLEKRALHRAQRYAEWSKETNASKSVSRMAAREIPRPHPPVDQARRDRCQFDLRSFAVDYFPARFPLAFSPSHLSMIDRLQEAVLRGGQFAVALPRGSGKTTLCEVTGLWAILYAHRRFPFIISATGKEATRMMSRLRSELECNPLLEEDFSDAVGPIHDLRGIARRAEGQTFEGGELTHLLWTKEEVRLPVTAAGGGSVIRSAGMDGAIRGALAVMPDGEMVRPDLILLDDPQTDKTARSSSMTEHRMETINGTISGTAGPGKVTSCLATVTVIQRGDLADMLLDRKKHPEWQGQRSSMITSMPKRIDLWDKYAEILRNDLAQDKGKDGARAFYREHQTEMDEGGSVYWSERKLPGDVSALQHAMDLRIVKGEAAFQAEYQNEPMAETAGDTEALIADQVVRRTNGMHRTELPTWAECVTAFIDVQQKGLWYVVCAWGQDFRGQVIDYGTFPDQQLAYFTNRDMRNTLAQSFPGATIEAQIASGLHGLLEILTNRRYNKPDGNTLPLERCLIDANWQESTPAVYGFCKSSEWKGILLPSHGRYIGAATKDMDAWRKEQGEKAGPGWRITPSKHGSRMALYDTNRWKTMICARLKAKEGVAGITLWGDKPERHRCFADHCAAEYRVRTTGRGRELDEWKLRPGRDNHWWDGLVGAAVAASIQGIQIKAGAPVDPSRKPALAPRQGQPLGQDHGRKVMSLADMRAQANARRGA
jgi:hypothetical protein